MALTVFDIIKNILNKADGHLEDNPNFDSAFIPYMVNRYLSMRDELIPFACIMQGLMSAQIDNRTLYQWLYKHIPQSNPYIKYISKKTHKTPSLKKKDKNN